VRAALAAALCGVARQLGSERCAQFLKRRAHRPAAGAVHCPAAFRPCLRLVIACKHTYEGEYTELARVVDDLSPRAAQRLGTMIDVSALLRSLAHALSDAPMENRASTLPTSAR